MLDLGDKAQMCQGESKELVVEIDLAPLELTGE